VLSVSKFYLIEDSNMEEFVTILQQVLKVIQLPLLLY